MEKGKAKKAVKEAEKGAEKGAARGDEKEAEKEIEGEEGKGERVLALGTPNEKQKQFFLAGERYVAYGGARGGGKSWAVRVKALLLCLNYRGCRVLILRRTLPELCWNHVRPLQSLTKGLAVYSETKSAFTFQNGSVILCGFCAHEGDTARYQGQEFDFIFIDEATQFPEKVFDDLKGCLRGTSAIPKRFYLTCNPGGVGHAWVKRLFVDRKFHSNEDPRDYRFIKARLYDNKVLLDGDPDYLKALQSLPDAQRRAWLDGSWDLFDGQYFEEFDREVHVVRPFPIPDDWLRYAAFDYGLDMLACLWFAVSPSGEIFVYRELHEPGLIVSEAAERMRGLSSGERLRRLFLPPDMASRQKDSGLSMEELFARCGITGEAADNRRVPGWLAVKELLRPQFGEEGDLPRLRVFSTCTTLISHLPALLRDSKDPNDAAVSPHEITHICDALRYFALSYREETGRKTDPLFEAALRRQAARSGAHRRATFC